MSLSFSLAATVTHVAAFVTQEGEFDETQVTPGVAGFVVTALVGLVIIFLGFDLVRRLRRSRYRHEIREKIAAEIAESESSSEGRSAVVDESESAVGSLGDSTIRGEGDSPADREG